MELKVRSRRSTAGTRGSSVSDIPVRSQRGHRHLYLFTDAFRRTMHTPAGEAPVLRLGTPMGTIPLGFARNDHQIFLIARERSAVWPVELLRSGFARVNLPEGPASGSVRLVTDPGERDRILALFRERYGPDRFQQWYDHPARVLVMDTRNASVPTDLPAGYYAWLEAEFDNVATEYDHHITGNRMNRLLRDRSLAHLRPLFRRSTHLIEVGCGSGMETIPMLNEGHEILAVDISRRMLEVVREKAKAAGVSERLRTKQARARDLGALVTEYGSQAFDGGYSTYGALNCEPDLRFLPVALGNLLQRNGAFVAGIYNRWCLFEMLGYASTFQWRRALGRRRNPVRVGASRFCVDIYAYSAADFRSLFGRGWQVVGIEAVPIFLPPSDLTQYSERFARHFDRLARWDASLGSHWPWSRLGDHFLMTAVKTGG